MRQTSGEGDLTKRLNSDSKDEPREMCGFADAFIGKTQLNQPYRWIKPK